MYRFKFSFLCCSCKNYTYMYNVFLLILVFGSHLPIAVNASVTARLFAHYVTWTLPLLHVALITLYNVFFESHCFHYIPSDISLSGVGRGWSSAENTGTACVCQYSRPGRVPGETGQDSDAADGPLLG